MKTSFFSFLPLFLAVSLFTGCSDDADSPGIENPDLKGTFSFTGVDGPLLFEWGEEKQVKIEFSYIRDIEEYRVPSGWKVDIDMEAAVVTITSPSAEEQSYDPDATLQLRATDAWDNYISAEITVYTLDYSHEKGTFFILEGNYQGVNGSLSYLDQYGRLHRNIYQNANGSELGSIVQDIFIANGKIYILSQNGNSFGGDGRLVVADARTMKKEAAADLDFSSRGVDCWPQHLVVAGPDKAYIQYATSDWEANSGIRELNLSTLTVSDKDVEGTYGTFNSDGATKGRMLFSRGKVYAACGTHAVIIDPVTGALLKTIEFERIIKGIVKGNDGNIYMPLAGEYVVNEDDPWGDVEFTSEAVIVGINHDGDIISEKALPEDIEFSVSTAMTSIGLCADFNGNYIYFTTGQDFVQSSVCRYNYLTGAAETDYRVAEEGVYGYMGMHPYSGDFFISESISYTDARFTVFHSKDAEKLITVYDFPENSPGGVDFAYRFSDTYINL